MSDKSHAKLGASGAHRWLECAGSISLEEHFPEERTSPHAAHGTAAHELGEKCLREDTDTAHYKGDEIEADGQVFPVNDEMVDAVQQYVDYVRDQKGELLIEKRVDFSPWVPEGFGTADAVILNDGTATIVDLKYGKGVRVDAEQNPQAMCYALGALHEYSFLYEIRTFRLVIVQPRLDHISEWDISRDDLMAWATETLQPAAALALSPNPTFSPGDGQCRFCRAKGACRAYADYAISIASEGFSGVGDAIAPSNPDLLENAEIGTLLPQLDMLSKWVEAVKERALSELLSGGDIPDHKLVAGRSLRKWRDEGAAEEALRKKLKVADAFVKKLISPAQAEKKLGKSSKILSDHCIKPEGKPTIAPMSDTRPALEINSAEGFLEAA